MDWFSSDWHLGHETVYRLAKRPFDSLEQMDEQIVANMLEGTSKGDNFYFLGDFGFKSDNIKKALEEFKKHKVRFHWILGNHDERYNLAYFASLYESVSTRRTISRSRGDVRINLCHFPQLVWNNSFRNSYHLFGHVHASSIEQPQMSARMQGKCLNVNLEFHDYKPWSLDEVIDYMEQRDDNWDYKLWREQE